MNSHNNNIHEQLLKICKDPVALATATHYLQTKELPAGEFYRPRVPKQLPAIEKLFENKSHHEQKHKFTFIDLFAGIGGMHIALRALGGKCIFSSEWDKHSQQTYTVNFGEFPFGDITKIRAENIPNHDILAAGFPCQAFSIAGKRGGFDDTRGTLFFDVARIIKEKQPKAFILENVKGLANHNRGSTLQVILNTLRDDLDYYVPDPKILNAKDFGVPQNRERIIIVGFRKDLDIAHFDYPAPIKLTKTFKDVKERNASSKHCLSSKYWKCLQKHKMRHAKKGNGFGFEIIADSGIANAVVVGGMGRERNLVKDHARVKSNTISKKINSAGIRKMTPREWARLQGFPDSFKIPVSDTQAYRQFGNAVPVPVIKAVANNILPKILRNTRGKRK